MKLTNAFPIVLATLVPKVSFAQTCTDENGSLLGDSGILNIQLPGEKVNTNFIRRGSEENCPCSYVQATCRLGSPVYPLGGNPIEGAPGDECNKLVVDGVDAAANGYPQVNMEHILQLCNYNDNTNNRIKMVEAPARAKVEFLFPDGEGGQVKLVDQSWNEEVLAPNTCFENIGVKQVESIRPKYFMEAILQGPQETPGGSFIPGAFCYAYSYNKIDIGFFYEPYGQCEMRTELDCKLTDGSGRSCKDYINENRRSCTFFEGEFTAKACNDNDRDVEIQDGASNYKINIYERKNDGRYKRRKEDLPEVIAAGDCANFSTRRLIRPCEKNFWQVNVEGKEYNGDAEFGWFFKDKDCLSYSFDELPVARPDAPTPSPTDTPPPPSNPAGTSSPSPTGDPTSAPSDSVKPTGSPTLGPTVSMAPTGVPTSDPTLSTTPTRIPTADPTASMQPTSFPTFDPTVSMQPTGTPSSGPTSSTAPTGVPTVGPTVSTAPTGVPTFKPSISVQPTNTPTANPTLSHVPTRVILPDPSASATPTPATKSKGKGKGKNKGNLASANRKRRHAV